MAKKSGKKIMGGIKPERTGGAMPRNTGKHGSPVGTVAKAPKGKRNKA
jgi:hypothetical protein